MSSVKCTSRSATGHIGHVTGHAAPIAAVTLVNVCDDGGENGLHELLLLVVLLILGKLVALLGHRALEGDLVRLADLVLHVYLL